MVDSCLQGESADEPSGICSAQILEADLILLHAPSIYDFRERDDLLFAYLSDSDSVNVTSIYEMYPIGFLSIKQRLRENGYQVEIVNLASLMLKHPQINVEKLLGRLEAPVFGFDLHWMTQCHGAIELAKRVRAIHPEALIVFGGISATYYADELIRYSPVDVVVKGYDTLEPLLQLMEAVRQGGRCFDQIPNLVWKKENSDIAFNNFSYKPKRNYNDAMVDWSFYKNAFSDPSVTRLIMTLPNTGCAHDCSWCGGSHFAYTNIMGVSQTLIPKNHSRITDELRSLEDAAKTTSIYALQCYSESTRRMREYIDAVAEMRYKSVFFEQFNLTDDEMLQRMGRATQAYIMLSPESHDLQISRLAGRGNYTMQQLEEWIPRALDAGIAGVMIWFFIGMPRQTRQSVLDTVAYSERLLKKFNKKNVLPLICPMVPFLDPGSRFFEEPEKHGYRLFHRTLEEHRRALVAPLWHQRLNYQTEWLSRSEIQDVTYEAVARLVTFKGELGVLPASFCRAIIATINETKLLLSEMEHAIRVDGKFNSDLRDSILRYNRKILAYSSDQIMPMPRPFGGRWFDDFAISPRMIQDACNNCVA